MSPLLSPFLMPEPLKGKRRRIKNVKNVFEQKENPFTSISAKPKVIGNAPATGVWETFLQRGGRSKVRKSLISYHLKPTWLLVIGCPSSFDFVTPRLLWGLHLGLLTLAAMVSEPRGSNGLL